MASAHQVQPSHHLPTLPTAAAAVHGSTPTVAVKFVSAGLAACVAEIMTLPLDTAKVRLQIQGELSSAGAAGGNATTVSTTTSSPFKYRGVLRTVYVISSEEGVRALYNGLVAGLHRQLCFASIRIGLYDSVKHRYISAFYGSDSGFASTAGGSHGGGNILLRIAAGVTTGAVAVSLAQPTDVVKVRMQAQRRTTQLASGAGRSVAASSGPNNAPAATTRYRGCRDAYRTIAVEEGVRGLWKGVLPNITRNAVVNAAELVSYDLIKESILQRRLMADNWPCHFVSAFGAGFCTTCIASPVDVVKTRYMNSRPGAYRGAFHCAALMYRERGGLLTFYKGFMPSFMRLGSWNIAMFVTFEQLKRIFSQYNSS